MADNNGVQEQDLDAVEDDEPVEQPEGETPEGDEGQHEPEAGEGDADDEVVITIGEEAPPHNEEDDAFDGKPAPKFVKDLRVGNREKSKRIRELEQQLAAKTTTQDVAPKLGPKPTLEAADYDPDRFETELTAWHEQKRAVDDQAAKQAKEVEDQQKAYQARLSTYSTAKAALKVPDYDDAEEVVTQTLNATQQGIIVSGADNAANVIYYLGKNPAKAKEFASIQDPVKYAFAVAKLETQLKVTPRKAPPTPEKVVRGSATAVGINDPKLARLEDAANKSGDRTELVKYKLALKAKAKA